MSPHYHVLRQRFLRQQQESLNELSRFPDAGKLLRELIQQLYREAPAALRRFEGRHRTSVASRSTRSLDPDFAE